MLNYYRAVRRKTASFLNGYLMPRLGVRLERVHPKRFQYEQAGSRDGYTLVKVRLPEERVEADVYLREGTSDWFTFKQIFLDEDYDLRPLSRYRELKALYASIASKGTPLIVDLGGNIGMSALYFGLVWPKARVVAVEPDEGNFKALSRNMAARPGLEAIHAGISSRPTRLSLSNRAAGENAVRTGPADGGASTAVVEGITVPQILDKHAGPGGSEPFILKIDIEGAEADLFSSNVEWIDRFPLIIIELHDWLYPGERTSSNFLRAISQLDRDFLHIGENIFSIRNRTAPDGNRTH
jgi:FkbM family methyltransferase